MKKFFLKWGGWFLFLAAIVSVSAEILNYSIGNFNSFRATSVCAVSSLFITLWKYSINIK